MTPAVDVPLAERRLAPLERIHTAGVALDASFEFFPARTEEQAARLAETADRLRALRPRFVSVTYGAGGTTRDATMETVHALALRGFAVAAHLTCIAHSTAEVRALARAYRRRGVRHIVALRGDLPAGYTAPRHGLAHASDLVRTLREQGIPEVSVATFPEGHPDTGFSLAAEVENLKRKEDAGATRAITQLFFDNACYLRLVDEARAAGVTIPIVPGILPVTDVAQVRRFAETVGASVPRWLDRLFEGLDDDPATRELVAASVAAEQCADLATHGVRHVHVYTLNRSALSLGLGRLLGLGRARAGAAAA